MYYNARDFDYNVEDLINDYLIYGKSNDKSEYKIGKGWPDYRDVDIDINMQNANKNTSDSKDSINVAPNMPKPRPLYPVEDDNNSSSKMVKPQHPCSNCPGNDGTWSEPVIPLPMPPVKPIPPISPQPPRPPVIPPGNEMYPPCPPPMPPVKPIPPISPQPPRPPVVPPGNEMCPPCPPPMPPVKPIPPISPQPPRPPVVPPGNEMYPPCPPPMPPVKPIPPISPQPPRPPVVPPENGMCPCPIPQPMPPVRPRPYGLMPNTPAGNVIPSQPIPEALIPGVYQPNQLMPPTDEYSTIDDADVQLMKLLYTEINKKIYPHVEKILDEFEYVGSPVYSEQIDRETIAQMVDRIIDSAKYEIDEIEEILLKDNDDVRHYWSERRMLRSIVESLILNDIFGVRRPRYRRIRRNYNYLNNYYNGLNYYY